MFQKYNVFEQQQKISPFFADRLRGGCLEVQGICDPRRGCPDETSCSDVRFYGPSPLYQCHSGKYQVLLPYRADCRTNKVIVAIFTHFTHHMLHYSLTNTSAYSPTRHPAQNHRCHVCESAHCYSCIKVRLKDLKFFELLIKSHPQTSLFP